MFSAQTCNEQTRNPVHELAVLGLVAEPRTSANPLTELARLGLCQPTPDENARRGDTQQGQLM